MEAFLPSEIGRLIYGYLFQQCGEGLAEEFLNTCDSMRECRLLKQKYAKNFHHKVQDLSLEDILNQYSLLCSLIFKQATGEEPVHRNILSLLKKVLSSKLLGLSSSSVNRSRVVKPAGDKVGSSMAHKIKAVETDASAAQSQLQTNPAVDDNVAFSPGVSDAGDDNMDLDDNDASSEDILKSDSVSNATEETASVVKSTECSQKKISPSVESRICAVLCDSAAMEERVRQPAGRVNFPFPAEYCTPRKQQVISATSVTTPISSVSATVSSPTTVMKSIENVSKNLSSAAESGPVTPKSGQHSSKKTVNEVGRKEKVLQQCSNETPSKTSSKLSTMATTPNSIVNHVSPVTSILLNKKTDQLAVATPSFGADEVLPATTLVNLPTVQMPAVSLVNQEPRVSATLFSTTDVLAAPIMTSSSANIPEISTENVFGELSFESECSLPGKLDKSTSSVKSDSEVVAKLPMKHSPQKPDALSVDSSLLTRSEGTISPVQSPTAKKAETTSQSSRKSTTEPVELPDAAKTTPTCSASKKTPWDLNLRVFVDNDSSVDAHITKRKPKDQKYRKPKEVPKKRKHNDCSDDTLSTHKRFKSDTVAAVPVSVATARQPPLVSQSVDTNITIDHVPSPSRRRRCAKDVESTLASENRSDKNEKIKGGSKDKRMPKSASTAKSLVSKNDVDLSGLAAENEKVERSEKVANVEKKKKQQTTNAVKPSQKEIREAAKTRNSTKRIASVDEVTPLTNAAKGRKKSERIEERLASKKKSKEVDLKNAPFKEPNLPHIKEKPFSSLTETDNGLQKDAQNDICDDLDKEADKIPNQYDSSIVAELETPIDDSINDNELDFEMILEISPEFELYYKFPLYRDG
ncbi:hypothetical protein V9T40_009918 [Parthenolecanium corni]|uniref:Uncharacterized protein n=1 Tax=Parthenolecanium corni TaxID=536013 RepID=A0AAN9Y6X5_9HEMI